METKSDNICRGCMISSSNVLQPLFVNNIAELFYSITSLNISHDDGLPNSLCLTCMSRLEDCNRFKNQCTQSDVLLRKIKDKESDSEFNRTDEPKIVEEEAIRKSTRIKDIKANVETEITHLEIVDEPIEEDQFPSDNEEDDYCSEEEEEENIQVPEAIEGKPNKKSRPYIPKNLAKNYDP